MNKIKLYPYMIWSESAKAIANRLGSLRVFSNRNYKPKVDHLVVNWGNSNLPDWWNNTFHYLNHPNSVRNAVNKLRTLEVLAEKQVPHIPYVTHYGMAETWIEEGYTVYERHQLEGNSGNGIRVVRELTELDHSAPLYTKGVKAKAEYRVHVFNGEVIDYIKKLRTREDEPTQEESDVRSHNNGWIFAREGIDRLERVEQLAIDCVKALDLDFAGVDIIMDQEGGVKVLEVNTACGVVGTTLDKYEEAILNYYEEEVNN